jgi:hypothetical protein
MPGIGSMSENDDFANYAEADPHKSLVRVQNNQSGSQPNHATLALAERRHAATSRMTCS